MQRIFILIVGFVYMVASSTLAHGFCINTTHSMMSMGEHTCCDNVHSNCYTTCLGSYDDSNAFSPLPSIDNTHILDRVSFSIDKHDCLLGYTYTTPSTIDMIVPPRIHTYIGTTKQLE